jgi:hypothetical protein
VLARPPAPRRPALDASSSKHFTTIRSSRDLVGLPVAGSFHESYEEDGTIFRLPRHGNPHGDRALEPHPAGADQFDQVVSYLADATRYAKRTAYYRAAALLLAAVVLWLRECPQDRP